MPTEEQVDHVLRVANVATPPHEVRDAVARWLDAGFSVVGAAAQLHKLLDIRSALNPETWKPVVP